MQHAAAVTATAAFTATATAAAVTAAAVLESRAARLPAALYNNNNTTSASLENEREQGTIPTLERFCISFPSRCCCSCCCRRRCFYCCCTRSCRSDGKQVDQMFGRWLILIFNFSLSWRVIRTVKTISAATGTL